MSSQQCYQCGQVKRCQMFKDAHTGRLIYLCRPCARELGYLAEPDHGGESG